MNGKRHRRSNRDSSGGGGGGGGAQGTEPTQTDNPGNTDSARQRIVTELEALKNQKADSGITVGHEVETKKHSYVITREIMKGRMSRVFEVRRNKDSKVLFMKAHLPTDTGKATILRHEAHIYHELSVLSKNLQKDEIRFLNIYDYGECTEGQFLFLTPGGESLANILSDEKVPSYQTALDLSFQMLNVIEQIHQLGFIHCRIRPHTFITGLKPRERYMLFIINFSLARMANPTRAETIISRTPPQIFDRYAPRCQHFGLPYHRRDDLESWFYICCDLFHPHFLPWSSDKRLKSQQMAELKEKLMKGELFHRYAVMPKPFQAFAGAIYETDGKLPNYNFFKECLMEDAKAKNCSFYSPWEFMPVASLTPVPELQNQTRIEFEFNQCVKSPTTFNFGTEKSHTVLPDDGKELSQQSSDVQIILPNAKPRSPIASPSKGNKNSKRKKNESLVVSMTDVVKNSSAPTTSDSGTKLKSPATKASKLKTSAESIQKSPTKKDSEPKSPAKKDSKSKILATKDSKPKISVKANSNPLSKEDCNNNDDSKLSTDASSDEDDDDNEDEEQFKLKSPPIVTEKSSSTGPTLVTFHKSSAAKPSTPTTTASSSSTTSTGSTLSSTSGSGTSASSSDSSTTTISGTNLSKKSSTTTAVPGNFKKDLSSSLSSSSASSSGTSESSKPRESVSFGTVLKATSMAAAASPQKSFQKNESVYFGIPTDAGTPANTSGYLKPHQTNTTPKQQAAPSSPKNESVYFAPK